MKIKPCKHCAAGNSPQNGEHWIVKSVAPAKITIIKCPAATIQQIEDGSSK